MGAVMPKVLLAPPIPAKRLPESTTKARRLNGEWLVLLWATLEFEYVRLP
jgi:hypothetical protein